MWEKDEGIAEALSTYKVAADFCDMYPDYVFNHNESVLYEWVEEYDPELFVRIQEHVKNGRWNIMGGWYLQPDCNMPSGESIVRQILTGLKYFEEKFGKRPTTAINFDSFGHSRGLVQILAKAGYDSYIACRPLQDKCSLPADDSIWRGFDGSEVVFHRGFNSYESHRGKANLKIMDYMKRFPDKEVGMVLWGVGNHGGGPSQVDYERIVALGKEVAGHTKFMHSGAEAYFAQLKESDEGKNLQVVEKSLHYHSVGCYTSMIRIKQQYRLLENMLFKTEKMASHAALSGLMEYPQELFADAEKDMLFSQFHDILPGTCISVAEEAALRQLGHGIEICERIKIKAFLMFAKCQQQAKDGDIPIFVYNPHPTAKRAVIECEFNLPDQNTDSTKWSFPRVYQNGAPVPCQVEHEDSNFNVDWRKRVVFEADLPAMSLTRFECIVELWQEEPAFKLQPSDGLICFETEDISVKINCATGGIDEYTVSGKNMLKSGSFIPIVMEDDYDSWGNRVDRFRNEHGKFKLMESGQGAAFSGIEPGNAPESVRVIEDGDVRSVVEAVFSFSNSFICQRYYLPKKGTEIIVKSRVVWNEKMKMLKLPIISQFADAKYVGQVMYGREQLPDDGMEAVSQRFSAIVDKESGKALTFINNGTYGSDFKDGEMRVSMLRSAGFSAGCSDFSKRKPEVMEQGRCNDFIDQGVRHYTFHLNAGDMKARLKDIETEAAFANEVPFALSCFPTGANPAPLQPLIELDNTVVQLTAFKKSIYNENYIIRLFEPTGEKQTVNITMPLSGARFKTDLAPFEIVTLTYDINEKSIKPIGLLER